MTRVEVISISILKDNDFVTICNSLSSNDLSSLQIKDKINAQNFLLLSSDEKAEICDILSDMCKKHASK